MYRVRAKTDNFVYTIRITWMGEATDLIRDKEIEQVRHTVMHNDTAL
jgi:hypothetical protein